jgi:hypothetical protein
MGMVGGSAVAQSLVEMDPASVSDGHVYLMDNVSGNVPDVSANSNNGNLIGDPQIVAGLNGEALQFNGVDDGVHLPDAATINTSTHQNHTVIAVFNCADVTKSEKQVVYEEGGTTRGLTIYVHEGLAYAGGWNLSDYTPEWTGTYLSAPIGSGEWHVVAAVLRDGTAAQEDDKFEMWMDGEQIGKGPGGQLNSRSDDNGIGHHVAQVKFHDGNATGGGGFFEGMVDEIWILNQALSEAELRATALTRTLAKDPVPADEGIDASRDGVLSWTPGEFAQTHDVYFGTVFDDVNDASRDNPMDALASQGQADTTFDPGRLEFGVTYYWRVDEVNGTPDNTIYKGDTWSFTAELLAYPVQNVIATSNATSPEGEGPENTVNGSGLNELDQHSADGGDMWAVSAPADGAPVTITFEFERVEKLQEMLVWNYNVQFEPFLGYSFKDVTVEYSADGVDWTVQGDVVFAQGEAVETYTANTTVTFGGVAARFVRLTANTGYGMLGQFGLSEVRFNSIPVHATEPQPAEGASGVSVSTALSWKAGREAATHDVSLSTDPNALALIDTASDATVDLGPLDLAATYYWKVDEVNEAETLSVWEGPVWSFSTEEFVVVDDFESYDDEENRIFDIWIDGFINDTGSTVGYFEAPFAETTTTHGGAQSMPLAYDNTGGITVSEATRTLDAAQDWSQHGIKGLLIWFFGDPGNDTVQMYIKIDNTRIDYDGDASNLARTPWQLWYVDLTGRNVSSVDELTIGFEGSGAGIVFIDDIMLSPYDRQQVTPVEPDPANLVAHFPRLRRAHRLQGYPWRQSHHRHRVG